MREFKDIIKGLRAGRQLTQDELATELGLSRSAISMYERGEREPDFETLEDIADFFNVDMNYLTGWSEDPTNYDDPDLIATIPLTYMEACDGDVERAFKMMKAVEQDAAEEAKKATAITKEDECDIARDLEVILAELGAGDDLMFDGNPMTPEARESIMSALRLGLEAARAKNRVIKRQEKIEKEANT